MFPNPPTPSTVILAGDVTGTDAATVVSRSTSATFAIGGAAPVAVPIAAATDPIEALISFGLLAEGENWPLALGTGAITAGPGSTLTSTSGSGTALLTLVQTDGNPFSLTLRRADAAKNIKFFQDGSGNLNIYSDSNGIIANLNQDQSVGLLGKFACNGVAPPAQAAAITQPAATASTQTTPFGYTTNTQADAIVTAVRALVTALHNNGITA